jgi:hypothetical protein
MRTGFAHPTRVGGLSSAKQEFPASGRDRVYAPYAPNAGEIARRDRLGGLIHEIPPSRSMKPNPDFETPHEELA